MDCENTSKTETVQPIGFIAQDLNYQTGAQNTLDSIYTNFTDTNGMMLGNQKSKFFADKTLGDPEWKNGAFAPAEKRNGWLIFQMDDRATQIDFGIIPNLNRIITDPSPLNMVTANVPSMDTQYLSKASLLCRKYPTLDYDYGTCELASLGSFEK